MALPDKHRLDRLARTHIIQRLCKIPVFVLRHDLLQRKIALPVLFKQVWYRLERSPSALHLHPILAQ